MSNNQKYTNEYIYYCVNEFMTAYDIVDKYSELENPMTAGLPEQIGEALSYLDPAACEKALKEGMLATQEYGDLQSKLFGPGIADAIAKNIGITDEHTYDNYLAIAPELDNAAKRDILNYIKNNNADKTMVSFFEQEIGKLPENFRSMTYEEIKAHATETAREYFEELEKSNEKGSSISLD
jgi:hypothetical protein